MITQTIITVISIIVGALLVVWQIGRQFKDSLKINKQNKKNELYLEIYKDFEGLIEKANDNISISMTVILNLPNKFSMQNLLLDFSDEHNEKVQAALSKLSIPYEPPPKEVYPIEERANQILDQNYEAQTCIIKLIRKLEAYEIAFQDFTTIKNGIVKKLQEYREQHNVFFLRIVSYLPTDVPELKKEELGVKVLTNLPPDEKTIQELRSIADKYMEVSLDLTGYIWDLQVALQNRLLGELFDNKVSIRKPNDPRYKVLDLDNNKGV